tara:strand:+ start:182 stop:421 length:240 start_codon:yes stop_codon:yes gene_type:complete
MAIQGHITLSEIPTTGSINKIYAPSDLNITSIAFGTNNSNPAISSSSYVATIAMIAGGYLEGPIVQYAASAVTIAYMEK